jgi:hypothetical protein
MNTEQYSELSIQLTKQFDKKTKKEYGIFITPRIIIEKLFDRILYFIETNKINIKHILEPACGTCEIVNYMNSIFMDTTICAIEVNNVIYQNIKNMTFKNNHVEIFENNFLNYTTEQKYDLIVTNPPYFVYSNDNVPLQYKKYITGRPNIFGLFILHSLSILKDGGILGFIIPKSFMNSAYYAEIRKYIVNVAKILEIIDFEDDNKFLDTQQGTFGLIIQKYITEEAKINESEYFMKLGNQIVFTNNSNELKELLKGSTTLSELGLGVKTGNIVWNEYKNVLTHDPDYSILIYNSNINDKNQLEIKNFNNVEKKQYIKVIGLTDSPIIVVNRGNGNTPYKLKYSIIDINKSYMIENHLNVIYSKLSMSKEKMLILFNQIIKSFENEKTNVFIKSFLGNNGLSKTELETIFPIYL